MAAARSALGVGLGGIMRQARQWNDNALACRLGAAFALATGSLIPVAPAGAQTPPLGLRHRRVHQRPAEPAELAPGPSICTIAFSVAAGIRVLASRSAKTRPDRECMRLWMISPSLSVGEVAGS